MMKRTALRKQVLAENPSDEAIGKASGELGESIGDAAVLASKVAKEVRPVLTPDQIEVVRKTITDSNGAVEKFFDKALKAQ